VTVAVLIRSPPGLMMVIGVPAADEGTEGRSQCNVNAAALLGIATVWSMSPGFQQSRANRPALPAATV